MPDPALLPPPGNPRETLFYRRAEVIHDLTGRFCARFLRKGDPAIDRMVRAARSGRRNMPKGFTASTKTELKLASVARASLGELLADYENFLRTRGWPHWAKASREARYVRRLEPKCRVSDRAEATFVASHPPAIIANIALCLIHQANHLLDQRLRQLGRDMRSDGRARRRPTMKKRLGRPRVPSAPQSSAVPSAIARPASQPPVQAA